MKKVILSLGGSIVVPDGIDTAFLKRFRELILSKINDTRFVIFIGGGKPCRTYQKAASEIVTMTNQQLDWIGIYASRLNAVFMQTVFGDMAEREMVIDPTRQYTMEKPIRIGAGWKPGWSTDYDAVQFAAQNGVDRVVNLSNIQYAYDKDPKQFPDARPIQDIAWSDFRAIVGDTWTPGLNTPFDPIAATLAEEKGIEVIIADGRNLQNLEAILLGHAFEGTRIHP